MGKKIFEITATVRFKLTEEDVTDLVVGALEGGIGYWSILDNSGKEFTDAPKEEAISETAARILIEGGELRFFDVEDKSESWILDMEKLAQGIRRFVEEGYDQYGVFSCNGADMGMCDAEGCDTIFQLALFDKTVFC